jgi:hypothetical protein
VRKQECAKSGRACNVGRIAIATPDAWASIDDGVTPLVLDRGGRMSSAQRPNYRRRIWGSRWNRAFPFQVLRAMPHADADSRSSARFDGYASSSSVRVPRVLQDASVGM